MDRIKKFLRIGPREQESDENDASQQHEEEAKEMSLEELLYSTASFHAICKPVAMTMILTALCVIFINTPETLAANEQALSSTYVAFQASDDASTAEKVGLSLTNALIIVSVICAMTFVIVLLYKYRCLKCLIGYMVLASAALLGFLGGSMFAVAINKWYLAVDQFSYYFCLWNFAIVGTAAIFAPWGGFPTWITQAYLIATSVLLAWQLAALDPWTSWALLVMLALYDLCAVLTPCGPLKALVNLMSQDDSPDMPGLLYEAELPPEAQRPGRRPTTAASTATTTTTTPNPPERQSTTVTVATSQSTTSQDRNNGSGSTTMATSSSSTSESPARVSLSTEEEDDKPNASDSEPMIVPTSSSHERAQTSSIEMTRTVTIDEEAPPPPLTATLTPPPPTAGMPSLSRTRTTSITASFPPDSAAPVITGTEQAQEVPRQPRPRASIPFAIAKLYKLPIEEEEPERRSSWTPLLEGENLSPNEVLAGQYTPAQLKMTVTAIFPRNGGRIETVGHRFIVKDRHGNLKRVLLMNDQGQVLEERRRTPEEEREEERKNNTIKLGLVRA